MGSIPIGIDRSNSVQIPKLKKIRIVIKRFEQNELELNENNSASDFYVELINALLSLLEGGRASTGFMCGCKQWSNDIDESNYNMQPITIIQFAVSVGAYVRTNTDAPCMFIWAVFGW